MTLSFRVERDQLRQAVEMVAKLAARQSHLPALSGVRVEVEGDKLHLAATDLDTSITTTISVAGVTDGVAVIPARRLAEAVGAMADGAVTVCAEGPSATIKSGSAKFVLPTYAPEEFPRIVAPVGGVAVDGPTLRSALAMVLPAASINRDRPQLTGVFFRPVDGLLQVAASDSYRLHVADTEIPWEAEEPIIVPAAALRPLVKSAADTVLVTSSSMSMTFGVGETVTTTRLIEGEPPQYWKLIPATTPLHLIIGREDLLAAVERVGLAASIAGAIRLDCGGDGSPGLTLSGKGEDGTTAEDSVVGTWDGAPLTVGFNASFLRACLDSLTGEVVSIGLTDTMKPAVLRGHPGGADTVALLMPIRLS